MYMKPCSARLLTILLTQEWNENDCDCEQGYAQQTVEMSQSDYDSLLSSA
jgi:hypothetical protein